MLLRWQVRILAKESGTYDKLKSNFIKPELNFVIDDYGSCYMQSVLFDKYKDESIEEVLSTADKLVKILNGILKVNLSLDNDVLSTQEAIIIYNDGKKRAFMFDSDTYDLQGRVNVRTELNHDDNPLNNPEKWVDLALKDEKVQQVLSIIRFGINDAVVMYKVYEIIRDDLTATFGIGNKRPKQIFTNNDSIFTDKRISSFTGSVNDVRVLGDKARHAEDRSKDGEMDTPLSLQQCEKFIYNLLYSWLHYKQK